MGALRFTRYALSVSVAAILLSACGGSTPLAPAPGVANNGVAPLLKSRTFNFTGGEQKFKVPNGVTSITIVARGASGAGLTGGRGGRVYAVIPVHPQEKLYVFVGGEGYNQYGGFNGGGNSGCGFGTYVCNCNGCGSPGGGASDIRIGGTALADRIIVAGGGGGEGGWAYVNHTAAGGKGGGATGGAGQNGCCLGSGGGGGGDGGSQYQGGTGGYGGQGSYQTGRRGKPGSAGQGGNGGNDGCYGSNYCYLAGPDGAGGGGGYYGGGGGGGGGGGLYQVGAAGGGGGGSSYIEPDATKYQSWQGWKNAIGNGLVVISWK